MGNNGSHPNTILNDDWPYTLSTIAFKASSAQGSTLCHSSCQGIITHLKISTEQ